MESDTALLAHIGARIATRRAALNLTLEDVAVRSGVSRAMVSRIERGEVQASAVVLDRLCGGLGMTLSALFARDAAVPLLRHADQPAWTDPDTGYVRREVAPAGTGSPVAIVEVAFPPGAEVTMARNPHRAIGQHVWVLEGTIEIALPGATHRLAKGDCLHTHPDDGITFRNPGGNTARYAVIVAAEGKP